MLVDKHMYVDAYMYHLQSLQIFLTPGVRMQNPGWTQKIGKKVILNLQSMFLILLCRLEKKYFFTVQNVL